MKWKCIDEWPYAINEFGVLMRTEDGDKGRAKKGTIIQHIIDSKGYHRAKLYHEGRVVPVKIHRLVCWYFNGLPHNGERETRHLDGNPDNNHYTNLCWGTAKENSSDRKKHGRRIYTHGEEHPSTKYSKVIVARVKKLWSTGKYNKSEIARMLGVNDSWAKDVIKGKIWKTA